MTVVQGTFHGRVLIIHAILFYKGMEFGRNRVTGLDRFLSSWWSTDDPSEDGFLASELGMKLSVFYLKTEDQTTKEEAQAFVGHMYWNQISVHIQGEDLAKENSSHK